MTDRRAAVARWPRRPRRRAPSEMRAIARRTVFPRDRSITRRRQEHLEGEDRVSESKPGVTDVSRAKLLKSRAPADRERHRQRHFAHDQHRTAAAAAGRRVVANAVLQRDARSARIAGTSAGSAPASMATITVNARTGRRPRFRRAAARPPGRTPRRPNRAERRAIPQAPPIIDNTMFSVSHCATMRPRLAPSARRIVVSRRRDVARASSRFETFAHAISSTNPTAPASSHQRRLGASHDRLVGARQPHAPAVVRLWIGRFELRGDRVHFRLGRAERGAALQSADDNHEAAVARHAAHVVLDGCPHLHVVHRKAKSRRHHADDDVRTTLHHHRRGRRCRGRRRTAVARPHSRGRPRRRHRADRRPARCRGRAAASCRASKSDPVTRAPKMRSGRSRLVMLNVHPDSSPIDSNEVSCRCQSS